MRNFSNEVAITLGKAFTSGSATGIVESPVIDMAQYEGVIAVCRFGTTSTANGLQALMGTASASAGLSEVLDSYSTGDSSVTWLEIYRPKQRFVQFQAVREAATKLDGMYIFQYGARSEPVTNSTKSVINGKLLISPDTGQSTST